MSMTGNGTMKPTDASENRTTTIHAIGWALIVTTVWLVPTLVSGPAQACQSVMSQAAGTGKRSTSGNNGGYDPTLIYGYSANDPDSLNSVQQTQQETLPEPLPPQPGRQQDLYPAPVDPLSIPAPTPTSPSQSLPTPRPSPITAQPSPPVPPSADYRSNAYPMIDETQRLVPAIDPWTTAPRSSFQMAPSVMGGHVIGATGYPMDLGRRAIHDPLACESCLDGPNNGSGRAILAVDSQRRHPNHEPRWRDARLLPWESLAYGEYVGPVRTPHVPEYRVRVGDQLDFTYRQTRDLAQQPYRLGIGDVISINAEGTYNEQFGDENLMVLRDGTVQIKNIGSVLVANKTLARVQDELNQLAQDPGPAQQAPNIVVKVLKSETELNDLIRTVDATAGQGGQSRSLTVSPDGTVQLPALGSVPAIGLTLDELGAEANARYSRMVQGLEVTPSLRESAPTFAYVLGEANNPGRIPLDGPTTVMQLVAQAGGWRTGANLRQIVVFRRDEQWRLIATRLDLSAGMWGNRPHPSDDLWVRNNDIILLPKTPALRVVDFIDIYFTRGLYGVLPSQGFSVNFDGVSSL